MKVFVLLVLFSFFLLCRNEDKIADKLKQVPVLCYHQVRDWKSTDKESDKPFIIPVAAFSAHMKALNDEGYTPITSAQLLAYARGQGIITNQACTDNIR